MSRHALVGALVTALVAVPVLGVPSASADPRSSPGHRPPVDAAVVDPFRPPDRPYGPGNRGLEYGTAPGTAVAATAAGTVTFAGTVAGSRHVTVLHADGVRTSYSFLARVEVVVGQRVTQGQVLGTTAGRLHLGARYGDAYFDPASLFIDAPVRVRLVPFDDPPGTGPTGERGALAQLVGGITRAASWLSNGAGQTVRTAAHYFVRFGPTGSLHALYTTVQAWRAARDASRRPCTPPEVAPPVRPRGRRVMVLVGGLGSSSDNASVDDVPAASLGYAASDVVRFSYRGGRIPDAADGFPSVVERPYDAGDTQVDLTASGDRLAQLLDDVAAAAPDAVIDVVAHSQGGVVTRLALDALAARPDRAGLERIGVVATLGTPHRGADMATGVFAVGTTASGRAALASVDAVASVGLEPSSSSVQALAETSDLMRRLGEAGWPAGVRAVSIAARGDLVVPVPATHVEGSPQVVVPLQGWDAHGDLPGSPAVARELALLVAGAPPTCTSLADALVGQLLGAGISWAEDAVGASAWVVTAP